MLQDTWIIFCYQQEIRSLLGYCQAPSISKSKSKGPYFHFTKQFQHPRFHRSLHEIHSCQTSSSSIRFNWIQRTWDHELRELRKRKKKQSSPPGICPRAISLNSVSCARATVLHLLHMHTHATSWLLAKSHSAGITPTQPEPKQWRYVKT